MVLRIWSLFQSQRFGKNLNLPEMFLPINRSVFGIAIWMYLQSNFMHQPFLFSYLSPDRHFLQNQPLVKVMKEATLLPCNYKETSIYILFRSWINHHPSCLLITWCFPQHLKAANKVKIDTYQNLIVHNFAISRHWNTVTCTKNWMLKVFVLVEASKRFFFSGAVSVQRALAASVWLRPVPEVRSGRREPVCGRGQPRIIHQHRAQRPPNHHSQARET